MTLEIGTRVGPFEIQAALGTGGMGEVYKARDTRLKRAVALKILPQSFAFDPERSARFEREAQVLAALNHPNIAGIYGLEESGGIVALVLEFVDGLTLADRIGRGPIPIDEALTIARQIADAVQAAHDNDIIHRDLKPANIKLRIDGTVKVLDFGLAKLLDSGSGIPDPRSGREKLIWSSQTPTITSPAVMTGTGVILGTAAYMSPEQVRARQVDKRADVWAFGCVLYEMLAGRRAFEGAEVTDVLARILEREPDFTALPSTTPDSIRRLLRRCLQKNLSERLRDIADARLDIDDARTDSAITSQKGRVVSPGWKGTRAWILGLTTSAIAAAVFAVYVWQAQRPNEFAMPAAHVQIVLPPGVHVAVDTEHPALALSPDGSQLVFVGDDGARRQLYLRSLANADARPIPGTEGAASPFYAPDGAWIGFFDGTVLKKVSTAGGIPIAVHTSTGTSVNRGATWTLNDTVVIASSPNSGLSRSSITGELQRRVDEWTWITDSASSAAWPYALPNGRDVFFTDNTDGSLDRARVAVVSLESGQTRTLVAGGTNPRFSPTGHVLFVRGGTLYALAYDPERTETTGPERVLVNGVLTGSIGAAQFTVAGNGTLAYVAGQATPTQHEVVWVDRAGRTEPLLDDGRTYEDPRVSPDGSRLAFTTWDGANSDIWFRDLRRGSNTRLTTHAGEDFEPTWSPDGQRLAFASEIGEDPQNPGPALAWITAFDQRPEQLLRSPGFGNWEFPTSWSPDGRWLAVTRDTAGASRDIVLFPTVGSREPIAFLDTQAAEMGATFSPDGHWLAYVSDETGREEVYVRPFPGPGASITVSTEGGVEPRWARSGRELFYRNGSRLMAVTVADGARFVASAPAMLFEGRFEMKGYGGSSANYDVAADGRFVMIRRKNPVTPTVIDVVFNWPRALPNQ